jgi:HK97 family phage prohead protease
MLIRCRFPFEQETRIEDPQETFEGLSSIERAEPIDLLYSHDPAKILASERNKTLTIYHDPNALYFEAILANTAFARDVFELVQSGLVNKISPALLIFRWRTSWRADRELKIIAKSVLIEMSLTPRPFFLRSAVEIVDAFTLPEFPTFGVDEEPTLIPRDWDPQVTKRLLAW